MATGSLLAEGRPAEAGLYTCPKCGAEIPERRREAHETSWCPALAGNGDKSDEEITEISTDGVLEGLRLRKADGEGAAEQASWDNITGVDPSLKRKCARCPHGLNPHGCVRCIDAKADADSDADSDAGGNAADFVDSSGADPLADTPASARRQAWLSFVFLLLFVAPACMSGLFFVQEYLSPLVLQVGKKDAAAVKDIFFGGDRWLVLCVKGGRAAPSVQPKVLKDAAEQLRPHSVRVAEVPCWAKMETSKGPRTLAKRFKFRDSPPVVLFVADKEKPKLLFSQGDLTAADLVKQTLRLAGSEAPRSAGASSPAPPARGKRGGRTDHVGKRPKDDEPLFEANEEF